MAAVQPSHPLTVGCPSKLLSQYFLRWVVSMWPCIYDTFIYINTLSPFRGFLKWTPKLWQQPTSVIGRPWTCVTARVSLTLDFDVQSSVWIHWIIRAGPIHQWEKAISRRAVGNFIHFAQTLSQCSGFECSSLLEQVRHPLIYSFAIPSFLGFYCCLQ